MNNSVINMNFPITVYGNLEKFTDVLSLGRCRIFYKYDNRNGTYITDEFAEDLIKTLPYTPVKGIYEVDDYTDHGQKREEGRIYGIVPGPQDMNFAWEKHLDEDGVEREYACVNVYYYTALYEEAGEICGKSQSMELYKKSVKGDWKIINGKRYFVFEKASFLGLQVLGDDVEPCFEGAAFFALYDSVKDLYEKLEQYQSNFQNYGEGGNTMPMITFKVSDGQKYNFLWALLNPNYNEENNWAVEYGICDIYDEYAIVRNYAEGVFERVYYVKNDESDSLEITNKERCYMVDVNESEKRALDLLQTLNGNTYEATYEKYNEISNDLVAANDTITERDNTIAAMTEEISKHSMKIEELNNGIATLTQEKDEVVASYAALSEEHTTTLATLEETGDKLTTAIAERDNLLSYKKNIEDEEKKGIIDSYAEQLSEEIIDTYTKNMDNYSAEDLDVKLTYELKKAHPEMFGKNAPPAYIPKDDGAQGGINAILAKYKK